MTRHADQHAVPRQVRVGRPAPVVALLRTRPLDADRAAALTGGRDDR
ncbi:hypothetical protein ABZ478_20385 [Streptomyces sp. NPDC005706]